MATYDDVMVSLGLEPSSEPGVCGTYRGYARHHYYGEDPCAACRKANSAYKRDRARAAKKQDLPPIKHGTARGARRHWYRNEKPCDACRIAYNAEMCPRWRTYDRDRRRRPGRAA
ncbi:hypothetical protein ACGF5F_32460 [Streptomyces sp. NPDC047821]|uniref:hypothetical protein n=1 Tax=Streptomyces sp. NPDC047821 TaxID=3365488 RepID=UPI0037108461